jgi:hypothetical protein
MVTPQGVKAVSGHSINERKLIEGNNLLCLPLFSNIKMSYISVMKYLLILPFWDFENICYSLIEICFSMDRKGKYQEKHSHREKVAYRQCMSTTPALQGSYPVGLTIIDRILSRPTVSSYWIFTHLWVMTFAKYFRKFITQDLIYQLMNIMIR